MESNNEFEYTGKGCMVPKNVTIVRFHPSVVEVEYRAFYDCRNLSEVVFNDGLQKIGTSAFRMCTSLSSITLPSTVTEIKWCAFGGCSNLSEVVLNEGLQKIGYAAFCGCTSLSCITLPSTVTYIESDAFYGCNNLRVVVFHGVPMEIAKNVFSTYTSLERFMFPTISSRVDNLIQNGHWEEMENEVDGVRGVVERSGGELFVSSEAMDRGRNWNRVRQSLDIILQYLPYKCHLPMPDGTSESGDEESSDGGDYESSDDDDY